ncbi:nucleotide-binding domain-containing protein [Abortiporus biennis]|nr:nucleotide-binding domain-containing protein [Abortiporus biennis]
MPVQEKRHIVILGAGVIGMTIAHVLSTRHPSSFKITIVARDQPEDVTQAFASPWAGANWSPFGNGDEKTYKRESITFNKFWNMERTGLTVNMPSRIYYNTEVDIKRIWYKDLVRNFRVLSKDEIPAGYGGGVIFDTITVNPQKYLPWMKNELLSRGVEFVRRQIHNIDEAADIAGPTGILFNCTGLGARSLVGIEDEKVHPIRGQTITVHAPEVQECISLPITPNAEGIATYMIPRPIPDGLVYIGGTYQKNNWNTSVDFNTAKRIWEKAIEFQPALKTDKTRVVSHNVGLRPAREGGPRIELEWLKYPTVSEYLHGNATGKTPRRYPIIHCYGFGGFGYQGSWGSAEEAVDLLEQL